MGFITHDAAKRSPGRSRLMYQTVDSQQEVSRFDREELARLGRGTYENFPLIRHLVETNVGLVVGEDGFRLAAMTSDTAWNEENEERWRLKAEAPGAFDLRRRWDFTQFLEAAVRGRRIDGDFFVLMAKDFAGERARFSAHEGTMVRSPGGYCPGADDDDWADGVRLDALRGAAAYNFVDSARWQDRESRDIVIPANGAIHYADITRPGHVRGSSSLGTVINDSHDRTEIKAFIKHAIKIRQQRALYTTGVNLKRPDMAGAPGASVKKGKGKPLSLDSIYGAGEVTDLGAGGKVEMLQDDSPHMNYQQWDTRLVEEICLGFGLPAQFVWTLRDLTSANSRFLLEKTQIFRARETQKLIRQVAQRMYVYDTAIAIKNGIIREPSDPFWWAHGWLTPGKLTIDRGRMGAMNIALNRRGLVTSRNLYGCEGLEWKREISQWAKEEAFKTRELMDRLDESEVSVEDYLRLNSDTSSVSSVGDTGEDDPVPVGGDE